jgi:iron complex transport system substrate-binding protein
MNRIVSLLPSATEILYALGLEDFLLAVSHECRFPPAAAEKPRATFTRIDSHKTSGEIDDEVKNCVLAGQPLYGLNEALLRELAPDLIVTQDQCDVCAIRYEDVRNLVETAPELARTEILAMNPTSLDDALQDVRRVGHAAGVLERGRELFEMLRERVRRIDEITDILAWKNYPRAVCIEWIDPLMTAGNWIPELIELAGGRSGLAEPGKHSRYVTWEQIVEFNPEVLLVTPCGFDLQRSELEARALPALAGWNSVAAVQAGRVFIVDSNLLLSSGPRIVESLELIAHLLHPALFPVANLATFKRLTQTSAHPAL